MSIVNALAASLGSSRAMAMASLRRARVGEEVYFSENSVLDAAFERLNLGSEVASTLDSEDNARGARAASVRLLRS
jgi:hypothetical protein